MTLCAARSSKTYVTTESDEFKTIPIYYLWFNFNTDKRKEEEIFRRASSSSDASNIHNFELIKTSTQGKQYKHYILYWLLNAGFDMNIIVIPDRKWDYFLNGWLN